MNHEPLDYESARSRSPAGSVIVGAGALVCAFAVLFVFAGPPSDVDMIGGGIALVFGALLIWRGIVIHRRR